MADISSLEVIRDLGEIPTNHADFKRGFRMLTHKGFSRYYRQCLKRVVSVKIKSKQLKKT